MKKIIILSIGVLCTISCIRSGNKGFTRQELDLLNGADSIMRVLTIEDSLDNAVLRAVSHDFSVEALLSDEFERLAGLMVATVTHPSQDGVGIAGPQVGLNRRVVAVQRFDKEPVMHNGTPVHPFEVYPNIRIVWASDSLVLGSEGCLSVPNKSADVLRSTKIVIEYADMVFSNAQTGCPENHPDNRPDSHTDNHPDNRPDSRRFSQPPKSQIVTLNRLCHLPHAIQHKELSSNEIGAALPVVRDTVSGFTAVIFQHEIDHLDGILYIDRL